MLIHTFIQSAMVAIIKMVIQQKNMRVSIVQIQIDYLYKSFKNAITSRALHLFVTLAKSTTVLKKRVADSKFSAVAVPAFNLSTTSFGSIL